MSFLEHLDELRKRIVHSLLAVGVGVRHRGFSSSTRSPTSCCRRRRLLPAGREDDLHPAGRSVRLTSDCPDRGASPRRAVDHVSGLAVHRARALRQRKEAGDSVRAVLDDRVLCGAAFNHYVAFPFMMMFFASFNTPDLVIPAQARGRLQGCVYKMLLGMGVVFQMPTVVFFLAKMDGDGALAGAAIQVRVARSSSSLPRSSRRAPTWSRRRSLPPRCRPLHLSIVIAWIVGKKSNRPRGKSGQGEAPAPPPVAALHPVHRRHSPSGACLMRSAAAATISAHPGFTFSTSFAAADPSAPRLRPSNPSAPTGDT